MKQRILVAVVGLPPLLLVLLAAPAWACVALMCGISGAAAYELLHTAQKDAPPFLFIASVIFAVLQGLAVYWHVVLKRQPGAVTVAWLFLMLLFLYSVYLYGHPRKEISFSALCVAFMGGTVFPLMYSCVFLLRCHETYGKWYVLTPFLIAFVGDSCSQIGGMTFGKQKLLPKVSPNKTCAGSIAGVLGSILAMLVFCWMGRHFWNCEKSYWLCALFGGIANLVGQLGDLSMSVIKRENGVKDYSHLLLTHGGILDRFDSLLFIAPVLWFVLKEGWF